MIELKRQDGGGEDLDGMVTAATCNKKKREGNNNKKRKREEAKESITSKVKRIFGN